MCLPSICGESQSYHYEITQPCGRTYGTRGHTVEALLALDGDVGAVRGLELDIKRACITSISKPRSYTSAFLAQEEQED